MEAGLTAADVREATKELAAYGYQYDLALFPSIPAHYQWDVSAHDRPQSLAEALLWKMGKWKVYKSFVAHYSDPASKPKKTDVVFYAFARHLQNDGNPIYDQHALRALWAIDTGLNSDQARICRKLLTNRDGKWKPIISGSNTSAGYDLYIERISEIKKGGASLGDLDKLLMPLGQALKSETANVTDFIQLTDCAAGS
jgi:hypothetical protein